MGQHPVKYKDKEYFAEALSLGKKQQFCAWLGRYQLAELAKRLSAYEYTRQSMLACSVPGPQWTTDMTPDVEASLSSQDGSRQYYRLVLGIAEDMMPDKEFNEMILAKEAEGPTGDFNIALKMIKDESNPKAQRG